MSASAIANARITVVDDEPANATLVRSVLLRAGFHRVCTFTDARTALASVAASEPDLVLLDLHMPHIDGLGFIESMRKQRDRGFLPVLVLTADNDPLALKSALRAGANDFLAKPIDTDELLLRAQNLVSIRLCYQEILRHDAALAEELRTRARFDDEWHKAFARIRRATTTVIEAGGPEILFQPIVELASGRTLGVESLSRFGTEPRRTPDEWFADAASVGLGAELELSAIGAALGQRDELHPSWVIALNVSPTTLLTRQFREFAATAELRGLVFEITEHQPVSDYRALREMTELLQARGALISVDDAGAGFASLRHITEMHPDVIKLDISLTRGVDHDPVKRALAGSLVGFAEEIGAELTAEGIETAHELAALRRLGVHYGQGFCIAGPTKPIALLSRWPSRAAAAARPACTIAEVRAV